MDYRFLRYTVGLFALILGVSGCGGSGGGGSASQAGAGPGSTSLQLKTDSVITDEDTGVVIQALANDSGDNLELVEVSAPVNGTADIRGNTIDYMPYKDFSGEDTFRYLVRDGDNVQAEATILVTITARNDQPKAEDDLFAVVEGQAVALNLLDNDVDPDQDSLIIEIIEGPKRGTVDDRIVYTAPSDYNGYDEFKYRVNDPSGASDIATVSLTVYENADPGAPVVQLPRNAIEAGEVAVIVNDFDLVSAAMALEYAERRHIPAGNVIHVAIPTDADSITPEAFAPVIAEVVQKLPPGIQAYVLTWIKPFRVGCMSMTSAFAFGGYDDSYCNYFSGACTTTKLVDSYASDSTRPFDDHGIRPTMVLGGVDQSEVRALIDRGLAADNTFPGGIGHLVRTSDILRSKRWPDFTKTISQWQDSGALELFYTDNSDSSGSNTIAGQSDLLFYFTGLASVADIETNSFHPGAIADHMTSAGGLLTSSGGQMNVLRWLEAGATASYGTVVEPCNFTSKFPAPSVLLPAYYRGSTLLEAYWKSVSAPGEGIFVGEPLARPWGRAFLRFERGELVIRTTSLSPARQYSVLAADTPDGDHEVVLDNIVITQYQLAEIKIPGATRRSYILRENSP